MTTSKGTIQGYNGVAAVDKKHQVIIEAQAFGEGQEHHTLEPVAELIAKRYKRLRIRGKASYTDWMKVRVDSQKGKQIYSHRMSVVEPVETSIALSADLTI